MKNGVLHPASLPAGGVVARTHAESSINVEDLIVQRDKLIWHH